MEPDHVFREAIAEYVCRKRMHDGVDVFLKELSDFNHALVPGSKLERRVRYCRFVKALHAASDNPADFAALLHDFDALVEGAPSASSGGGGVVAEEEAY